MKGQDGNVVILPIELIDDESGLVISQISRLLGRSPYQYFDTMLKFIPSYGENLARAQAIVESVRQDLPTVNDVRRLTFALIDLISELQAEIYRIIERVHGVSGMYIVGNRPRGDAYEFILRKMGVQSCIPYCAADNHDGRDLRDLDPDSPFTLPKRKI